MRLLEDFQERQTIAMLYSRGDTEIFFNFIEKDLAYKEAETMFEKLHRWAIKVDQNHARPNLKAQRSFIRDFGNDLYRSSSDTSSPISALRHIYFTRIFYPQRDNMGAYVRLHFFVDDSKCDAATGELDNKLTLLTKEKRFFR